MEDVAAAVRITENDTDTSRSLTASTVKRKSDSLRDVKPKKKKKPKVSRPPRLGYTVEQGEDMLLIISNTNQYDNIWRPNLKGRNKNKNIKGKTEVIQTKKKKKKVFPRKKKLLITKAVLQPPLNQESKDSFHTWGQSLPMEVLVNIFDMVVHQDGALPFLCRVARVCQLWNAASASPTLWRSVSMGYCWLEPGKTQLPKTELKIRNTVNWLAHNRFSQLRDFSLNHWKRNVDHVVEVLSQCCPHLHSLKLSYCTGVTAKAFQSLAESSSCRSLKTINVQYSEIQVDGFVIFLENYGSQIREILFTHGPKNDRLLTAISRGCCPELQLLEINTKLDSGYCQLPICIQALQNGCPKLKTFRMLNVIPVPKMTRKGSSCTSGFPLLEELCMATTAVSFMTDQDLTKILYNSTKLRVLDLRGCSRITATGLSTLPCEELECLYWGLYFNRNVTVSLSKKGLHLLSQKWSSTLKELDLANQLFSEEDMEIAMGHLAQDTGAEGTLCSLNISGTKITMPALRLIIGQSTALKYLNLTSCRHLPRGLKKLYRGLEEIHQLLEIL
ncbi:hypothetical protein UPYG_G00342430 [Umbra pygmaea]|uniref:F-box domain-containing protein n=1 Tax=Umbra pygmaea TaxID=75934 RepID=A0ABD0VWW1_UMBPY